MKPRQRLLIVFLIGFASVVHSASGQFYAPDTEFHDPVQRMFVVEAARVLAWNESSEGAVFSEITYAVSGVDGNTEWKIEWKGKDGQRTKSAVVKYPAGLLVNGADYYRECMKQLLAAGWKKTIVRGDGSIESSFWRGAESAGYSRETSLGQAFSLAGELKHECSAAKAAELSGLLVHATLPGATEKLTLDGVLLARGAAWLALAEIQSGQKQTRCWSPILFLAGREKAALRVWPETPSAVAPTNATVSSWELWLNRPVSKSVYFFAVDNNFPPISASMIFHDMQVNGSGGVLAEFLPEIAGERRLSQIHNYAPALARYSTIGGGHILNGFGPYLQRREWLQLMKSNQSLMADSPEVSSEVARAVEQFKDLRVGDGLEDNSLWGLKEMQPLIRRGHAEGIGGLVPAAVATRSDLLNLLWESTGMQMGCRYRFVSKRWGIPDAAKGILDSVTRDLPGMHRFFLTEEQARVHDYAQMTSRLQCVDGLRNLVGSSPHPFLNTAATNHGIETFVRRCWLRPTEFQWQARILFDFGEQRRIADLIEVFKREAGPFAADQMLDYLTAVKTDLLKVIPRGLELQVELGESMPQPTLRSVDAIFRKHFKPLSLLERAQKLESVFWTNPDCRIEGWILTYYAQSGAFNAYRRFYNQMQSDSSDTVRVSNTYGPAAYAVGYLMNDRSLRSKALRDCYSGSGSDMNLNIVHAAVEGNTAAIQSTLEEKISRYRSASIQGSSSLLLRDFLPLLPALADPKHPDYGRALDHFRNSDSWLFLRYVLIKEHKLPKEDAIRFLGGTNSGTHSFIIVSCMNNDTNSAQRTLQALIDKNDGDSPELMAIASFEFHRMTDRFVVDTFAGLKPPGAGSLSLALKERLAQRTERPR